MKKLIANEENKQEINTVDSTTNCPALDTSESLGISPAPCGRYYTPLCEPHPAYFEVPDDHKNSIN